MISPKQKLELYREIEVNPGAAFLKAIDLIRNEVLAKHADTVEAMKRDIEKSLEQKIQELAASIPDLEEVLASVRGKAGKDSIPEEVALLLLNNPYFINITKATDGHTPSVEELIPLIKSLIPEVEDGEPGDDGHTPTEEELIALIDKVRPPDEDKYIYSAEEIQSMIEAFSPKAPPISLEEVIKAIEARPIPASRITGLTKGGKGKHGGGDIVAAGTNITISRSAAGVVTINSTGGGASFTPETPIGAIDSVNTVFTVTNSPKQLFLNGAYQTPVGVDYTLTGAAAPYTITYVIAPQAGSTHTTFY